jgi:hypothetical protein
MKCEATQVSLHARSRDDSAAMSIVNVSEHCKCFTGSRLTETNKQTNKHIQENNN